MRSTIHSLAMDYTSVGGCRDLETTHYIAMFLGWCYFLYISFIQIKNYLNHSLSQYIRYLSFFCYLNMISSSQINKLLTSFKQFLYFLTSVHFSSYLLH